MTESSETSRTIYLSVLFRKQQESVESLLPKIKGENRRAFAAGFCQKAAVAFAEHSFRDKKNYRDYLSEAPETGFGLSNNHMERARQMGEILSGIPLANAGFLLGNLYTSLLPEDFRNSYGIFYTPPVLVNHLLEKIDSLGFNWNSSKVIDPACGGSAFLSPVAQRIRQSYLSKNPGDDEGMLETIICNLTGVEIDPFAAWLSQWLLELSLVEPMMHVKKKLPNLIKIGDALTVLEPDYHKYDLVIGNPPFGKIRLSEKIRAKYSESIYGHANYYGLFTHLAVKLNNDKGIIAYVMPTSFLGGQYFKALRNLISTRYHLRSIDFITKRNGVFEQVLQEIALVVLSTKEVQLSKSVSISNLSPVDEEFNFETENLGKYDIEINGIKPWLLPRNKFQKRLLTNAVRNSYTLFDYGYKITTGQLVWNRHKTQLRNEDGIYNLPLIWAESVLADGRFVFRSTQKNHRPYFEVNTGQDFLVTRKPCIVVQRTTAREQNRRILAALIPAGFFEKHTKGIVIENHLNIISPNGNAAVSLEVLCRLLNSRLIDELFRCISGSVAVSAYELYSIPLPHPDRLNNLQQMISENIPHMEIEYFIEKLYGVENDRTDAQHAKAENHFGQIALDFSGRNKKS